MLSPLPAAGRRALNGPKKKGGDKKPGHFDTGANLLIVSPYAQIKISFSLALDPLPFEALNLLKNGPSDVV